MRREDETLCAYHDTNYRHHAKTADYTRDKASIDRFRAKCSLEVARDLVASAKQLIDSVKVSEED